jgi:hypothetical protein
MEGDRVSVKATIRKFVTDQASVTIPSFNFPFSIKPTKGAKLGDEVILVGEVTRADGDNITVDFDDGGRATLKADVLKLIEKGKQETFNGRDWQRRKR